MTAPLDRTRRGLAVAGAALATGLAADVLGRVVPDRLDVALGLGALALAAGAIVHRGLVPAPHALAPVAAPAALLAVALIWRDSGTLFALNLGGLLALLALGSPRLRAAGPRRASVGDYVAGSAQLAAGAASGAARLLFTEIDWRSLPDGGPVRRTRGALVGLAAAVPVAMLFGGLLMDADPVFERLMTAAFAPGLDRLLEHGVLVLLWSWLAAGLLRVVLLAEPGSPPPAAAPGRFGLVEVGTVLLVVNLLFLAFVAVQFRYLFGGSALVREVTGLSYAEYARQGFFQLVAVAALSLPLLLVADRALGPRDRGSLRRFRVLASIMVLLLDVLLASALWRMRLYTAEYGLTELRLYTTAFMGWLVLVFGWLGATVLRGRRERFGFGSLVAALFVLGALNLLNPDGVIAGTNLARAERARSVDVAYLGTLGADAVPAIRRSLPGLPWDERCQAIAVLAERWRPELARGTRWNIASARAARELRQPLPDCRIGAEG